LIRVLADEEFGKSSVKGRIIIKCSDTDVLVICVHYYPRMQNTDQLWLLVGSVTHIEDSRSGSLSCERSESSANEDLISLKTDLFSNTKDSRSGITTSQSMNRWVYLAGTFRNPEVVKK
jgi:hypothetical protein